MAFSTSHFVGLLIAIAGTVSACTGGTPPGPKQGGTDAGVPADSASDIVDAPPTTNPGQKTCAADEHLDNGSCVANVRACTIDNGVGEQTWTGEKFGNCALKSCNSGFQKTANTCTPSVVGKFKTPCGLEASDGLDEIWTNDFVDNTNHSLTGEVYGSNNGTCTGVLHRVVRQIGTYKRIKASATVPDAVELDFTKTTVEVTLRSAQAVSDSNAAAECGKTDWAINTTYTFAWAACTSNPALVKTINKVQGDTLYVGNFQGPKDASGRPQTLNMDPTRIGTRVP